jgi:cytochrome bd-type quinol oxidase subunit 1
VRGGAGRPEGGAMKSLLGVLNRTETFALLFDLSSKNVLLYFLGFCIFYVVLLVLNVVVVVVVVAEKLVLLDTTTYYRRVLVI